MLEAGRWSRPSSLDALSLNKTQGLHARSARKPFGGPVSHPLLSLFFLSLNAHPDLRHGWLALRSLSWLAGPPDVLAAG